MRWWRRRCRRRRTALHGRRDRAAARGVQVQQPRAKTAKPPRPLAPTRPVIQVTIDLPTLLRLADHPGELAGYGPIPPEVARQLAAGGDLVRLVTDPLTGRLLDYGRTRYRPPEALARFVAARDVTCRCPGCINRPAAAISTTRAPTATTPTPRAARRARATSGPCVDDTIS
jgi:hypothetical protein